MAKDYYAVLGLDRDCTTDEIKAVYREEVKLCHPDVAGDDPEKTARFQELTEAYKVLVDPFHRKMHDQELPIKSYPLRRPTPERAWKEVTDVLIMRSDRIGPFQRALQAAKPLAIEEDVIIVGYSLQDYREGAHLEVAGNRRALLDALELVLGRKFDFRYIQGESVSDWEKEKEGELRISTKSRTSVSEPHIETMWEELMSRMHRGYNELPRRQQPQMRASFFFHALGWINETAEKSYAAGASEESSGRGLAKAIERLANLVDLPPTMVAIELTRRKYS